MNFVYRRSDISSNLISIFEREYHEYYEYLSKQLNAMSIDGTMNLGLFLKQKEVFCSLFIETNVAVECFRGKADVQLLMPDIDTVSDLIDTTRKHAGCISSEDKYFFIGEYNPNEKSLRCVHKDQVSDQEVSDLSIPECRQRRRMTKRHGTKTLKSERSRTRRTQSENRDTSPLRETKVRTKLKDLNYRKELAKKWSVIDRSNFQSGIALFGKEFGKIQCNFLPNKTVQELVEFYYMEWKVSPGQKEAREKTKNDEVCEYVVAKQNTDDSAGRSSEDEANTLVVARTKLCMSCDKIKPASMFQPVGTVKSKVPAATFSNDVNYEDVTLSPKQQPKRPSLLLNSRLQTKVLNGSASGLLSGQPEQTQISTSGNSKTEIRKLGNLCSPCQIYWKKHAIFKNGFDPNSSSN